MSQPETLFCPYVGLQPYTEAERDYFFGRERDQRVIVSNLYAAPLTVLYGASGVGKSSVLLAGVVPRLRATPRTAVVVFRDWQDATFLRALKGACVAGVEQAYGKPLSLDANLPLDELLARAAQTLNGSVVILLDQFEEYFLYHSESPADDSFDAEFARAVNREEVNASFLISLREDGLSKLDRFRTRIPNLLGNTLRLQHLDAPAAEDAIRKPLGVFNARFGKSVSIEDELVRQVVASIQIVAASEPNKTDARIETPFLQLVMTRLWDEEMKEGSSVLRMATLQRLGGAEQIVRTHLDRVMDRLRESERSVSVLFFDRLVTPSGAKIAQRVDDLIAYAGRPEQQVRPILKKLSDERVLRPIAPPPGQPSATRYEIFHDVLAPAILDWRQRYVQAKERGRRLRLALIGLSVVSAVVVMLAIVAVQQANQAETQRVNAATQAASAQTNQVIAATEAARSQSQVLVSQTQAANARDAINALNAVSTAIPQGTSSPDPTLMLARATAAVAATSAAQASEGWCPCATTRPIAASNFDVGRSGQKVNAVVLHSASGSMASIFPTFNRPNGFSSAHLAVGKDGRIEQYVSIDDTAFSVSMRFDNGQWFNARGAPVTPLWQDIIPPLNPNLYTVSIVFEGFPQEKWTPQMYDATNLVLVWLATRLGINYIPHHTLIGFSEIDPVDRANSPGPNVDFESIANDANAPVAARKAAVAHEPWIAVNDQGALFKFAQAQNLGYPQTDEFQFSFSNATYVGQVFNLGIVYVKQGEYGNIKWVQKTTAPAASEAGTAVAAANNVKPWMPINSDSVLFKFAQKSNLGYQQTDEFEFAVNNATYIGQVFNLGIVYEKKGDIASVKSVSKP